MFPASDAAAAIVGARSSRCLIPRLPETLRPANDAEAYAIQDRVIAKFGIIGGWKVGQSPNMGPSCAPVFANDILPSGISLDISEFHRPGVEVEFAFRLDRDLASLKSKSDVLAAFSFVPLIEVIGGRFDNVDALSPYEKLADQNGNEAFIVGRPISDWQGLIFQEIRVELFVNGEKLQSALDTHPTGTPVPLLLWQIDHCTKRGHSLKPGDIVTTGSLQGSSPVKAGDDIIGCWAGLSDVVLHMR